MQLEPIVLEGRHVRLVPFAPEHAPALWAASKDSEGWKWLPFAVRDEADVGRWLARGIALAEQGAGLGFVLEAEPGGDLAGMTGFWNLDREHRRVEIGATWVGKPWQRTAVNTEAKLLMMRHAFDVLGCLRVEFKTDARNERSRAALLRIGAKEEGTLRSHMILPDGTVRDSVYFSVVAAEWPAVALRLEAMLAAHD